jgi:hypothetical protein
MSGLLDGLMEQLGRKQRSDGLDSGGLANMLGGERKAIDVASPGLGGLSKILDRDGDGNMFDDIKDMAGGLLGGASGGGGGAKGGLGGLFGKLFGRK